MRERSRATVSELRTAISCLPRATRIAMLEGIKDNEIIVGAYSREGGICPMLAAHRAGGRTSFITFAKAWDRFAFRGSRDRQARRATQRELLILRTHLEASLLDDDGPAGDLRQAISEHQELRARSPESSGSRAKRSRPRRQSRVRPGDSYRGRELRHTPGWSWGRLFRRYDDYQRALARLDPQESPAPAQPRPHERALS
jgi:hypothetical protein